MKDKELIIGGASGGPPAPRQPVIAKDTLRSEAVVTVIEALSEGEIEGFLTPNNPGESVFFNDTQAKVGNATNFGSFSVELQRGLVNQPPVENLSGGSASSQISVNTMITPTSPVIRAISGVNLDAIRVNITLTSGLSKSDPKTGDILGTNVQFGFQIQNDGGPWQDVDLGGFNKKTVVSELLTTTEFIPLWTRFSGKVTGPYTGDFLVPLKQFGNGPYSIKVTRHTPDRNQNFIDDIQFSGYTEIKYSKLTYPNTAYVKTTVSAKDFSDIPQRAYAVKGIKVRVPTNYDPVNRTYSGVWNGTFNVAWTRNPAWVLYDMILNERYGIGKFITASNLDKFQFYEIAQYCDELVSNGEGGTRHRFTMDLYLQEQGNAKEVLQNVASAFNTMLYWHSGGVYLSQDRPKQVKALFAPANVIHGQFAYASSSRQQRFSVVYVKWADPTNMYKETIEYVEDPQGLIELGYRETTITATGTTSRAQAHAAGLYFLYTNRLETESVMFSTGLEGIAVLPGDIIAVNNPLKAVDFLKRAGGRTTASSGFDFIGLDAPAEVVAGSQIYLTDANGTVITRACVNPPGTTSVLNFTPPLPVVPEPNTVWLLDAPGANNIRKYRVLDITENDKGDVQTGMYSVTAITYEESKFAAIDQNLILLPPYKDPTQNPLFVLPVNNLHVSPKVLTTETGVSRFLEVGWDIPANSTAISFLVSYSVDEGHNISFTTNDFTARITNLVHGLYTISVIALGPVSGTSEPVYIDYNVSPIFDISLVSITNLNLKLGGVEFQGKNAEFTWDTDIEAVLALTNGYATAVGGQTPWFRDFEVTIKNPDNSVRRIEYVTENAYTYTFEKNQDDGGGTPTRLIQINVKARDFWGAYSQTGVKSVSNPAPSTYGAISLTPGVGCVYLEYTPPSDPDYAYTNVYASTTSSFTPDSSNLVCSGSDRFMTFPTDLNGTYWVKLEGIDEFGPYGTNFSAATSVFVISLIKEAVDTILAEPGRDGDFVVEANRFLVVKPGETTPKTAVFGVGQLNGVTAVGIRGNLLIDGSITANSLAAGSVTASKIYTTSLSSITANVGNLTIDSNGSIISIGKTYGSANAGFYLGNTGGTYKFDVGTNLSYLRFDGANVQATGVNIYNSSGALLLGSGTAQADILNNQITLSSLGFTGDSNATYGANSSTLQVGAPNNLLTNPGWELSLNLWGQTAGANYGLNLAGFAIAANGIKCGTVYIEATTSGLGAKSFYSSLVPALPNTRYECSIYSGSHRCSSRVYINFYNSAGTLISSGTVVAGDNINNNAATGGPALSNFKRIGIITLSPSGTAGARMFIEKGEFTGGSPTTSYFVGCMPYLGKCYPNQTEFSEWTNGLTAGFEKFSAANISTYISGAAIGSALIDAAAIKTAHIETGNITTLKIAGNAVTVPEHASAAVFLTTLNNTDIVSLVAATTDVISKRLIFITVKVGHFDSTPGYLVISLVLDNTTVIRSWYLDPPTRLVAGSSSTSFGLSTSWEVSGSHTFTVRAQCLNGGGASAEWAANPNVGLDISLAIFTGKR